MGKGRGTLLACDHGEYKIHPYTSMAFVRGQILKEKLP